MEILVHLRREVSPDDLEWNTIRNWRSTLSKSHTRHGMDSMEYCKNPWDRSPPDTGRNQKSPLKWVNLRKQWRGKISHILEHKWMSDVDDRYLLRTKLTTENQLIPSKWHKWCDMSPRLEGGTDKFRHGLTLCEQGGPKEKLEVLSSTRD